MQKQTFTLQRTAASGPRSVFSRLHRFVAFMLLLGGIGVSTKVAAQSGSINNDGITLTVQPTNQPSKTGQNYSGNRNDNPYKSYTALGQSSKPAIAVPQLGTFDLNNKSSLIITGASLTGVITTDQTTVDATRLQYRVYLSGTADALKPAYTNVTFNTTQQTITSTISTFSGNSGPLGIDLISGLVNGGTYVLDIRFQTDATRTDNDVTPATVSSSTLTELSAGDYFLANFYVTPPPTTPTGGTTVWQSTTATGGSTDWRLAANWSNGVPTATSNAVIPAKTNSSIVYPILNDATAPYEVNNLTLQGTTGSSAAQLTINIATLRVYGNISQPAGGLTGPITQRAGFTDASQNSTIILAGADQIITGQLLVADIIVAGSGVKSVINTLIPSNTLAFRPTNPAVGVIIQSASQDNGSGTVQTVFDTTGNSYISLVSSSTISTVAGDGETNVSYVKGVTRADRLLVNGVQNAFGNIGLDLTANHTPGNIFVYRVVGDPLTGPLAAGAVPTKRYYQIRGDDDSRNVSTAGSSLNVVFHYLDSDDELNGIQESNLNLFSAQQNGAPFRQAYGTLDAGKNIVTRLVLPSAPNFYLTLGDVTKPLPVSLTAFAAVRTGANALVSWTTATELNNKGFNVQVSADGVAFRTLGFVASKLVNSSQVLNYTYNDTEAGKNGTRYYRLEQVDVDGKVNYSPVRAVSFDGNASTSVALVAYPNPFSNTVGLTLEGVSVSNGTLASVKVVDMTGRTVRDQQLALNGASLSLGDLSDLRSGLYLAKVTLPDGSVKTVRIQRQ
jgi:hypothetical protein